MTESTARAKPFTWPASPLSFYTWEVPGKPICVRIPYDLMDRLERDAVENFRSLNSRGSEIGGLLVGSVTPGTPAIVSLADYEIVACDYSITPLYRLSDADLERFDRAIRQRMASGQAVAGFFRSHSRKGLSLDAADLTFFEPRFRDPHQIVLLVRPHATKASTAGIFIREGGKVNGASSLLEFPFRSSRIVPIRARREVFSPATRATQVPPTPPPAPVAEPTALDTGLPRAHQAPAEVEPAAGPRASKIPVLLCAVAASLALFVAMFVYPGWMRHRAKPASVTPDSAPLPTRVEPVAVIPRAKPSPMKSHTQPPAPAAPPATAPTLPTDSFAPATVEVKTTADSSGQSPQAPPIYQKDPEYPSAALQNGVQGQVRLVATIGKDGKVKRVEVISGHPLLQSAAADAVRQWVYAPTVVNGAPVETDEEILIDFRTEH